MQKIPTLFVRNFDTDHKVRDELNPLAEWVANGEGVATRKWDGTGCLIRDGRLFKRYDAKRGKTPPTGFVPAQPEADPVTGHWPGWLEVDPAKPEDKYHVEGFLGSPEGELTLSDEDIIYPQFMLPTERYNGTYELCGPKLQGNPEHQRYHVLIPHGVVQYPTAPRSYSELRKWLANKDIEGLVWWRDLSDPNCDKVKIKLSDFGLKRRG